MSDGPAIDDLSLVVRSHECVGEGFTYHHDGRCVTVFSAPHYCEAESNSGASPILLSASQ